MKTNRLLTAFVLTTAVITALPGCQVFTPGTPATQLTPDQQQARNETPVRVSASMGTRIALLAIKDDTETTSTAKLISTIAVDILAVTVNDQTDLTGIRDVPVKHITESNATAKQKLVAHQVVDSVSAIIQANIPNPRISRGTTDAISSASSATMPLTAAASPA